MREIGFKGYLVKPVRQSSLVARLLLCCGTRVSGTQVCFPSAAQSPSEPAPVFADDRPPLVTPEACVTKVETKTAASVIDAPDFDPPAIPAPFMEDHPAAARSAGPAHARASDGSLRILVAEDNPINMMLIRELLRRRGHAADEVATGTAAVQAMRDKRYDLLLTDIHMPGMDGIEAAKAIRADETAAGRSRTPIVALTADALEDGKQACQAAGMDGFLTKPVDPAELEEMFLMLFPDEQGSHIVAA
jgi:CheY-like chemotaxis protein